MTDIREVMIYAEISNGALSAISYELAALSRRLADELKGKASALLLGDGIKDLAGELISYGLDKVYVADDPCLESYRPEMYLAVMQKFCREINPEILLLGHTLMGRDLAPRIALKLGTGLATDCVEFAIDPESEALLMTRPVYGGKALATMVSDTKPQMATVRSKAFSPIEKDETRQGEVIPVALELNSADLKIKLIDRVKQETEGPKLEEAEVVVSGGRGMGRAENFSYLEELAKVLGGAVGGSRVAIDNEWLPSTVQVGLTGKIVSPRLYIAVGISGSTQHMAGCSSSQCIVAINNDPDAPIFQRARFGLVADFKEVLPTMTEACKNS